MTMKVYRKTRKFWGIDPSERVHSSKKGERGYKRSKTRNIEKQILKGDYRDGDFS